MVCGRSGRPALNNLSQLYRMTAATAIQPPNSAQPSANDFTFPPLSGPPSARVGSQYLMRVCADRGFSTQSDRAVPTANTPRPALSLALSHLYQQHYNFITTPSSFHL